MPSRTSLWPARCALLAVACCAAAIAAAQNPPSGNPSNANDEWLAQSVKLYYSSAKAGLKAFDCALHPDWRALYATGNGGLLSSDDAQRVTLLSAVNIALHGRMQGGSTLDWNPPAQPLNADQTKLLNDMHDALNQTITGFMQFWTPFVDGSVVPDSSSGLEVTAAGDGGKKIHLKESDIELSESFDSGGILREYDVVQGGATVDLTPTFSPGDHGLVITHFHALIRQADDPQKTQEQKTEEMNVEVAYQWTDGFALPARIDMEVTGVATLHMSLDGCTTQR